MAAMTSAPESNFRHSILRPSAFSYSPSACGTFEGSTEVW